MSDENIVRGMMAGLGFLIEPIHIGRRMWVAWVEIEPDVAQRILDEHNTSNRTPIPAQIKAVAAAIVADAWRDTHQGIAFDLMRRILVDGQNRLLGIVRAGRAARCLVFVYPAIEGKSVEAMDRGNRRRFEDQRKMLTGEHVTRNHGQTLRVFATAPNVCKISGHEENTLYDAYSSHIEWAVDLFSGGRVKGLTSAPVVAAIARAHAHVEATKLERFCEVLLSGVIDVASPSERTITTLRDYLLRTGSRGNSTGQADTYRKVQNHIKAYIEGRVLLKAAGSAGDLFPLVAP